MPISVARYGSVNDFLGAGDMTHSGGHNPFPEEKMTYVKKNSLFFFLNKCENVPFTSSMVELMILLVCPPQLSK